MNSYRGLYEKGVHILKEAGISDASIDSRILLEFVTGGDRNTLLVSPDKEVENTLAAEYEQLINKRASHIPLQHIIGVQNFMGLDFYVGPNVLIPRQDTETLVEEALTYTEDGMRVLDLCTGSGCILLSLMYYRKDIQGIGVDISKEALEVARKNAKALEIDGAQFLEGDLFETLEGNLLEKLEGRKFDVIVSNPPYISRKVIETLEPEVKDHEPYIALCGGEDGLDFYSRIAQNVKNYLAKEGRLYLEIGYDQGAEVRQMLLDAGFEDVEVKQDLCHNDRVVCAKLRY